ATASSPPAGLDNMPAACSTQVPMNIFATWEVDYSSPTCVPRLCSLTLTKLLILRVLEKELTSVVIAVRLKDSKCVLRSDELVLPPTRPVKIDLALTFSLQYHHSLKQEGNKLQIMLQKKLRQENQTILGYQTLAVGTLDMAAVLQRAPEDVQVLRLYNPFREASAHVAVVSISSLSSQPMDPKDSTQQAKSRVHEISEQLDSLDSGHGQDQEKEEDLDMGEGQEQHQGELMPFMTREEAAQKKVGAWLRRVREWEEDLDLQQKSSEKVPEDEDLNLLYDSLGDPSESNPSVPRTLNPWLRPHLEDLSQPSCQIESQIISASARRSLQVQSSTPTQRTGWHSARTVKKQRSLPWTCSLRSCHTVGASPKLSLSSSSPPDPRGSRRAAGAGAHPLKERQVAPPNKRANSLDNKNCPDPLSQLQIPREMVYDQVNYIISDNQQPQNILLLSASDWQGKFLSELQQHMLPGVSTCSKAEVHVAFSCMVSWMQKYCSHNSQPPKPLKIVVVGAQQYFRAVLWVSMELLSHEKPNLTPHGQALALHQLPLPKFFYDLAWQGLFPSCRPRDMLGMVLRITQYIQGANCVHRLLFMKPCSPQQESPTEESFHFIPFGVVEPGIVELPSAKAGDTDDAVPLGFCVLLSTPPYRSAANKEALPTPPTSPRQGINAEPMRLKVDYSMAAQPTDRKRDLENKDLATTEHTLKCAVISRLCSSGEAAATSNMSMTVSKEKNKKVLFLPKKIKNQSQCLEGISHRLCRQNMLRVLIEGVVWNDGKFLQLEAQGP
uniref:Phosphofurin acidic cluster sorting protein 2 n=1 Tax=Myotis lucifugus TaxID=59463 RepID=G1Q7Z6_MYOLU